MNRDEQRQLIEEMTTRWPDKIPDDELRAWATILEPYVLAEVVKALVEFKVSHAFAPKVTEIVKMLPMLAKPRTGPDWRTQEYRRQRDSIEASYAAGQPEREAMKSFFEQEDDDGLALLKAEFIATCPTEAHAALASRNVRESQILKQGIWAMVKQHVMK